MLILFFNKRTTASFILSNDFLFRNGCVNENEDCMHV